jgi:hypothetical protein
MAATRGRFRASAPDTGKRDGTIINRRIGHY